jgi:hypothetical protein
MRELYPAILGLTLPRAGFIGFNRAVAKNLDQEKQDWNIPRLH